MKPNSEYIIPFKGLKVGKHQFKYLIGKAFFEEYNYDDFLDTAINVIVDFEKNSTLFNLHFNMQGDVTINCDVSGEEFDLPVENILNLVVKFGEEFDNENDEILIIPHGEYELNISQYIYEMIVLSVPVKRVHPGVIDGTLKSKALEKLEALQKKENKTDPRWDKLKALIKDKNIE